MNRVTVVQQRPVRGNVVVLSKVIEFVGKDLEQLMRDRAEFGKEKHGQYLMTNDGRDTDTEIIQELIDSIFYCVKGMIEKQGQTQEIAYRFIANSNLINLKLILNATGEWTDGE